MRRLRDIRTEVLNFGKLFEKRISIPGYQREYRWAPRQIRTFLRDAFDAHRSGDARYFGGTTLTPGPETSAVDAVDGQQRITTAMLLLVVLRDLLAGHVEHEQIYRRLDGSIRTESIHGSVSYHLSSQHKAGNAALEAICSGGDLSDFSTVPGRNYVEAHRILRETVDELFEGLESVAAFAAFFLDHAGVSVTYAPDDSTAVEMYVKQHESMSPLDETDVLKGNIITLVPADEREHCTSLFHRVQASIWEIGGSPDRTVVHALRGIKGFSDIKQRRSLFTKAASVAEEQGPAAFLEESLLPAVDAIRNAVSGKDPKGTPHPALMDILSVKRLQRFTTIRSLFAAAVSLSPSDRDRLYHEIRRTLATLSVARSHPPDNERDFINWAASIAEGNLEGAISQMRAHRGKHAVDFARSYPSLDLYSLGRQGVRFMLGIAESEVVRTLTGQAPDSISDLSPSTFDIEHILPQSTGAHVGFRDADSLKHRLGNLTMLESTRNQSLKDADHASKLVEYSQSEYYLTRSMASGIAGNGRNNQAAKAAKLLETYPVWDEDAVLRRAEMLYRLTVAALDIPGAPTSLPREDSHTEHPLLLVQARPENTLAVFQLVGQGVTDRSALAARITGAGGEEGASERQAEYCLDALSDLGLLTKDDGVYILTDTGNDLLAAADGSEEALDELLRERYETTLLRNPAGKRLQEHADKPEGRLGEVMLEEAPWLSSYTAGHRADAMRSWLGF